MEQYYAIKRSDQWLWSSRMSRGEILARLEDHRITRDWLICPVGTAKYAVELDQFIDNPDVFDHLAQKVATKEARRRAIIASVEKPILFKIGQQSLKWFFICQLVGGGIVKVFFPDLRGAGLTPTTLLVLIPIWLMGGFGLLALIIGWLQLKYRIHATLKQYAGDFQPASQ